MLQDRDRDRRRHPDQHDEPLQQQEGVAERGPIASARCEREQGGDVEDQRRRGCERDPLDLLSLLRLPGAIADDQREEGDGDREHHDPNGADEHGGKSERADPHRVRVDERHPARRGQLLLRRKEDEAEHRDRGSDETDPQDRAPPHRGQRAGRKDEQHEAERDRERREHRLPDRAHESRGRKRARVRQDTDHGVGRRR